MPRTNAFVPRTRSSKEMARDMGGPRIGDCISRSRSQSVNGGNDGTLDAGVPARPTPEGNEGEGLTDPMRERGTRTLSVKNHLM